MSDKDYYMPTLNRELKKQISGRPSKYNQALVD